MLTLSAVFASHALFQAAAPLTVYGIGSPGVSVTASIRSACGCIISSGAATVGADGRFGADLTTPEASFNAYTITVTD